MDGKPARSVSLTESEEEAVKHLCLLTMKPVIYVANVAESDLAEPGNNPHVKEVMNLASELQSRVVTISAQVSLFILSYSVFLLFWLGLSAGLVMPFKSIFLLSSFVMV